MKKYLKISTMPEPVAISEYLTSPFSVFQMLNIEKLGNRFTETGISNSTFSVSQGKGVNATALQDLDGQSNTDLFALPVYTCFLCSDIWD